MAAQVLSVLIYAACEKESFVQDGGRPRFLPAHVRAELSGGGLESLDQSTRVTDLSIASACTAYPLGLT